MANFYVVATPIGNLEDISPRALRILKEVDLILCEDTRVTSKLLARYEIKTPTLSYHQHSKLNKINQIKELIRLEKNLALVSDAGTPGVSDPGGKLIQELSREFGRDIVISPIPGPSAAMALLSISGFPSDAFVFLGFPPHKKGRNKFWQAVAQEARTVVFYESPYRIMKSLKELAAVAGERRLTVGRELTKKFETIYRGTAEEITNQIKEGEVRGEFAVAVSAI
jgi:16S rRNA (cytidine1402-2'-O)-methyltransferase